MAVGIDALRATRNAAGASQPDSAEKAKNEQRTMDAARQFEALLISQMLRTIRESGGGWLGTGEDAASESATGMAEEQFAQALTAQGGLGLARITVQGLGTAAAAPPRSQKE